MGKGKKDILAKCLDTRILSGVTGIFFLLSMAPIWYLAFYARPSGDDFGYSAATRGAWQSTHSLIEVFKAGIETTKHMCLVWNGDWFSVFLFTLMPEVFVDYSFWIVPVGITLAVICATIYFVHEITVSRLGFRWYEGLMLALVMLMASYQFIPSTAIGMYWYVGVMHYMFPHVIALLLLGFLSKFERTGKARYVVYSFLGTIMIGGSSYFSSFLVFLIYIAVILLLFRKKNRILWLLAPLASGVTALFLQITAPGNGVRVGEGFGFQIGTAAETILLSLSRGITSLGEYAKEKPILYLFLVIIALFAFLCFEKAETDFTFPLPGVFVLFMYGLHSAMFTPEIYASVEISLGPATMQYFTFILAASSAIVYVEGWLLCRTRSKRREMQWEKNKGRAILAVCGFCILFLVLVRGNIGNSVFIRSIEYVSSGQAEDFRNQIASQMEILLDDSVKEAYLCPINNEQGPLMHMPVTSDPTAFTNTSVANFYGKDKVVMQE